MFEVIELNPALSKNSKDIKEIELGKFALALELGVALLKHMTAALLVLLQLDKDLSKVRGFIEPALGVSSVPWKRCTNIATH